MSKEKQWESSDCHKFVVETYEKCFKDIVKALKKKRVPQGMQVSLFSRVILQLFQHHFGLMIISADKVVHEREATPPSSKESGE